MWRRIAIPLEDRGCQQTIHRSFLVKVSPAESNDSFESRFLVGSTPDSFAETNPRKNLHFRNSLRVKVSKFTLSVKFLLVATN